MRLSGFSNCQTRTEKPLGIGVCCLIAIAVLISHQSSAEDLHDKITNAILGLASADESTKNASIQFLLAAPPEFRENMEAQYRAEAENLAKSLPQQIDAYTTAQGVLLTTSEMRLSYKIHFNKGSLTEPEARNFKRNLADQTLKQVCGTGGSTLLSLLYGRDLVRNYFYQSSEPFLSTRVTWNDCR